MTDDVPVTAWIADSFATMSVEELLEEWGQPMSAATRELLIAELASRGHDPDSLAPAPTAAADAPTRPLPTPAAWRARRRRFGAFVVLFLACYFLVLAIGSALEDGKRYAAMRAQLSQFNDSEVVVVEGAPKVVSEVRSDLAEEQLALTLVGFVLPGAFFGLWFLARRAPRFALSATLVLFVTTTKLGLAAGPIDPMLLIGPTLMTLALVYALVEVSRTPPADEVAPEPGPGAG